MQKTFIVSKRMLMFFFFCTLFSVVSANLFSQSKFTIQKKVTELKSKDGKVIVIPLKRLTTKAQYFSFKNRDGQKIRFFGLLDDEKKPHIAFDACDVCYGARKGYRQEGNMTICNNCGNKYSIKAIGISNKTGGCWPSYLPMTIEGKDIVITVNALARGQYLFPG